MSYETPVYTTYPGAKGGKAKTVTARIPVTPGETLQIKVGANGANGNERGLGGTASWIKRGASELVASSGGGGAGGSEYVYNIGGPPRNGTAGESTATVSGGAGGSHGYTPAGGGAGNGYPTTSVPGVADITMLLDTIRGLQDTLPFVAIWYRPS